jgi:hypothetical protein
MLGGAIYTTATLLFLLPAWLDSPQVSDLGVLAALQALSLVLVTAALVGIWLRSDDLSIPLGLGMLLAAPASLLLAVYLVPLDATTPLRQWAQGSLTIAPGGGPLFELYGLVPLAVTVGWTLLAVAAAREGLMPISSAVLIIVAVPVGLLLGEPALAATREGWHWSFGLAQLLGPLFGLAQLSFGLSLWANAGLPRAIPRRRLRTA